MKPHECCHCRDQGFVRIGVGARPGDQSFGKIAVCPGCNGKGKWE